MYRQCSSLDGWMHVCMHTHTHTHNTPFYIFILWKNKAWKMSSVGLPPDNVSATFMGFLLQWEAVARLSLWRLLRYSIKWEVHCSNSFNYVNCKKRSHFENAIHICLTVPCSCLFSLYSRWFFLTTFRKLYLWSYLEATLQILIYVCFYCVEKYWRK